MVYFYYYERCPFREVQIPVNQLTEELTAFLSERVRHVDAQISRIEWIENRLDAYLVPAPEETFQPIPPDPEEEAQFRRSMEILEQIEREAQTVG